MRARLLLALVCGASLLGSAARAEGGGKDRISRARTLFKDGKAKYDGGDYAGALASFQAGYDLLPKPEFLLNIGQAYRQLDDLPKAKDAYQTYLKLAPSDAPERAGAERVVHDLDAILASRPPARSTPAPTPTPAPLPAPPLEAPAAPAPPAETEIIHAPAPAPPPSADGLLVGAGGLGELLGRSAGVTLDAGARLKAFDVRARVILGTQTGLAVVGALALPVGPAETRLGIQATAFPGIKGYGGGPLFGASVPLVAGLSVGADASLQYLSIPAPYRAWNLVLSVGLSYRILSL